MFPTRYPRAIIAHPRRFDTRLTLEHGPYDESPQEQGLRIGHHLAGWRHFLPLLRRVAGPSPLSGVE